MHVDWSITEILENDIGFRILGLVGGKKDLGWESTNGLLKKIPDTDRV